MWILTAGFVQQHMFDGTAFNPIHIPITGWWFGT